MSFAGAGPGRDRRSVNETEQGRSRAGLKILIPGYPQWSWRQRARGFVLFGSYLVALGVGLFSWGTPVGAVVLAFAYGSHVASATDVIRQEAFPGFGRWVPLFSTSGGLGLGLYGPALALASLVAWPGMGDGLARDGYLVNCRAYRTAPPEHGEWVWLRSSPWGQGRLGRIVAGPGQEVEWSVEQLRVEGELRSGGVSWLPPRIPADLALVVPGNHALVAPVSSGSAKTGQKTPVLVPCGEIVGRAWARYYPIRERQLLR
jgi:hypothetical protein